MNQEQAQNFIRDWLPLAKALADGKTIEFERSDNEGTRWEPVDQISLTMWQPWKYRIVR